MLKLRLYVHQKTFDMQAAVRQVHTFLQEQHRSRSYILEVLDTEEHRDEAIADKVPFTPCLVRLEPPPRRFISMPALNHQALHTMIFQD